MHDVDRTTLEYSSELLESGESPLASEQYAGEYSGEQGTVLGEILGQAQGETFEGNFEGGYQESALPEMMEDELAAELLEVHNDQELDHFIGSLIKKAAGVIRNVANTPLGSALGNVLKQVAKKALPIAGGALGTFIGGPAGGMLGSKLASLAGDTFGLESEGLSEEDRDFEMARRYVRFAGHAARRAASSHPRYDPQMVVKDAVVEAARRYAPGLLTPSSTGLGSSYPPRYSRRPGYPPVVSPVYPPPVEPDYASSDQPCSCGVAAGRHRKQGKWIRRGRHIVLLGV